MPPEVDDMLSGTALDAAGHEVCAGCEAVAPRHPWSGIGHEDPDGPGGEPARFVAFPVCDLCHRDPQHRSKRPLKMHFFPRNQRRQAVFAARMQVMSAEE